MVHATLNFQMVLLVLSIFWIMGCTSRPDGSKSPMLPTLQNNTNNGQPVPGERPSAGDVGGGETLTVSEEHVKKVIEHAWEDLGQYVGEYLSQAEKMRPIRISSSGPRNFVISEYSIVEQLNVVAKKLLESFDSTLQLAKNQDSESNVLETLKQKNYVYFLFEKDYHFPDRLQAKLEQSVLDNPENKAKYERLIKEKSVLPGRESQKHSKLGWKILIEHIQSFSKLDLQASCAKTVEDHKMAWVSKHSPGATLCFDIQLLRKIPASSLKYQMLALLFHEFLHILGYDEERAVFFQTHFNEYLMTRHSVQLKYNLGPMLYTLQPDRLAARFSNQAERILDIKIPDIIVGVKDNYLSKAECFQLGLTGLEIDEKIGRVPDLIIYHKRYHTDSVLGVSEGRSIELGKAWLLYDGLLRIYHELYVPLAVTCQDPGEGGWLSEDKLKARFPKGVLIDSQDYKQLMFSLENLSKSVFFWREYEMSEL